MKNEVRPIDANALEQKIREYMNYYQNTTDILTACRAVLSMLGDEGQTPTLTGHFHDLSKMTPLTLEQLREKRGEWVYIILIDGEPKESAWAHSLGESLVTYLSYGAGKYAVKAVFGVEECGKAFLAYAYPPARIDREAWELCLSCCCEIDRESKYCHECRYFDTENDMEPCKSCKEGSNWGYKFKFCPNCGKPQEDEDWAELEKRLRG